MEEAVKKERKIKTLIAVLSVAIPLVVVFLFQYRIPGAKPLSFLPPIYASINGLTAVVLIAAVIAIKKGNQKLHQRLMTTCILFSVVFLGMYVAYHMTSESTSFGGEGIVRYVYLFILLTHIVLSIGIIPLVLITYSKAYLQDFKAHRKWAKITFPMWLYVAVTGVVVYIMISPYYSH